MPPRTGISSAAWLKKLAEASSLLLAVAGIGVLLTWAFHLPAWEKIVPGWAAVKATPTLVFVLAGAAAWIAVTVLLWFSARALHRAQEKIVHRERLYAVLSQCNQSIVHISERGPLLKRICEIAVELGEFRMAWIGIADPATQMVQPVASAGADEGFFERVKVSLRDEPLGRGPGSTAIREKRTVVCNDVHTDVRLQAWREETLKRHFHSAAGFPIRNNGDVIGCFVLYSGEVNFFNAEEVKLLEEMASDISFALKQMERDAQRRRAEEDKDRLGAELQMILDTVPAMIFFKNRQHRLVRANAAMIRTLGKPAEELLGKTDRELGTPYSEQYARDEDEIAATGQPKLGIVEPLATTNGVRWLQTDKVPLRDLHGNISGFIGLAVDITERKLAEAALQASEADFRASFLSTAVGQVQADPATGRYLRVNPRFCEITGYSEEELLGMTFRQLTHPDDRENDTVAHQQMVRGEISEINREKRYRRKDGTAVWVNICASIIREDTGRPLRTLAVVRDITARHKAEEARQAAEDKYRGLVEQSLVGIYIIQDGRYVYANPTFAQVMGYSAEELTAGRVLDFVFEEDRALVSENIRRRLEGECESIRYGLRMVRKDGTLVHIEVHGARAEYDGRPAILGTLLDLTERKKIEAQLLQAHKMEAIGQLAGGIAHDFNNILTAITGNTKLALEDLPEDHPARDFLLEIGKAGARAVDLVRRILTFSRQQPQERKLMHLQPVVEEALKLLRASLPATMEIRTTFVPDASAVLADATQIHQVIMNLGANAGHAMGEHGVLEVREAMVDVDADLARTSPELHPGRYVRLTVSDSGCGMDRATLARIFDPFFTTKAQGEGTGLGLSVVHGIMKANDGAITVYSEPGKGTAFHLYFPAAESGVPEVAVSSAPPPRGHGERLLYVDDEEPLVYLTTQVLGRLGYEVTGFVEAEAALEAFLAEPDRFDVIITDLSMPRLSGRDLAARILQVRPNIPIILATGYIRPNDTESARRLGIRDLILKPNTVEDLGHALHRILTERREESSAKPVVKPLQS
ncbi:MAG: PAS domain S-box protein [Chthoniobacter sp.]|uniref:PAS domain S-box protein n=1 Tax=Chthoniobacter sp. TaxID=2510640 RepID=UPI0032A829B6